MWTRPSDRAPSYGPCGQALEKLALPHRLPTLGALAPTSSPLLQQRFMRTATAPTPTASQIAPSSQAIRLRNKPANSPEDSTRQSAKQQPGQVRRAWWRTQVNRPLSVPELSSRCRTPGRRTTAQRPSSCPQGPATSPAMPDTGHRDSRISAATSLFISSQKSMQKTIVFHEILRELLQKFVKLFVDDQPRGATTSPGRIRNTARTGATAPPQHGRAHRRYRAAGRRPGVDPRRHPDSRTPRGLPAA